MIAIKLLHVATNFSSWICLLGRGNIEIFKFVGHEWLFRWEDLR